MILEETRLSRVLDLEKVAATQHAPIAVRLWTPPTPYGRHLPSLRGGSVLRDKKAPLDEGSWPALAGLRGSLAKTTRHTASKRE